MSLQDSKTVYDTFVANGLRTSFLCALHQCTELALVVNLQRKYAVQLETTQHGIFCETWLAQHNAQHVSHVGLDCFYSKPESVVTEIGEICQHLTSLLDDSEGGAL